MQLRYLAPGAGFALLTLVGLASAQSVPVTVLNQSSVISPSANAVSVTLGTFTLVSNRSESVQVASIPLTLTTGSGGNASDLSSCRIHAADGSVLGASGFSAPVSGSNIVMFDSATTLGGNQSLQYTVRCNVGNSIASGATYQFTAGTPTLSSGGSDTPSGPALDALLSATPVVRPGAQDVPMGVITLGTYKSNAAIQVSSLPITMSFGGGAAANMVTDCRVRDTGTLSTALNNGGNVPTIIAGSNVITFDSPLVIPAGNSAILTLTCDVASSAPSGGTILLSMAPSTIPATVSGSTTSVTPTTGSTAGGDLGVTSGSVLISPTGAGGPSVPGVPNTGLGGVENLIILFASSVVALFGVILWRRRVV